MARRVWHISDVHLSFDEDGNIKKPMNTRKWSVGTWTYDGYLEKIQKFNLDCITSDDFVVITGDVVHDMKQRMVQYSLRWLRQNISGTIVICRGNHDIYWRVNEMREIIGDLPRFHIVNEHEVLTIGPYTFGCYSNHKCKSNIGAGEGTDTAYLEMADRTVAQAEYSNTIPVMLSHYPVGAQLASLIGKTGIKTYLSGHIHCTAAAAPNGIDWDWYNKGAVFTDDKTIDGCFFSTGTTDVLLAKHGQIFKEVVALQTPTLDKKQLNRLQHNAAGAFKCAAKFVTFFEKTDPFNPKNEVAGYICRKKGPMQGSLYITHISGVEVAPQLIYGTPKLQYPYMDFNGRNFKQLPKAKYMIFSEKWNGMNVMFYKYKGLDGATYLSGKSKGTPFLSDSEVGAFLTLTKKAINDQHPKEFAKYLWDNDQYQSESYELCGTEEPHLVKYDFALKLKNLFLTEYDGQIKPVVASWSSTNEDVPQEDMQSYCEGLQAQDFEANEKFRKDKGLEVKYEYDHFATEGKVLYLCDDQGYLLYRTMYKIKPKDIEEVHWASFDSDVRGRTLQAIKKIKANEEELTEENLRLELDMGPKEWSKFGKSVMQFVDSGEARDCKVVVLCGIPGSGKSTIAGIMENHGYTRINQDLLGSRKACKTMMGSALAENRSVVIDRCNFNEDQRSSWIDLANKFGVTDITCVVLDIPEEDCRTRVAKRQNHPTIKTPEDADRAITRIAESWTAPTKEEGFSDIITVNQPSVNASNVANLIMETWKV